LRIELILLTAMTLLVSSTLTFLVRRLALSRGLLDVPNARSSHSSPTPRGGGLAIVLAACAGFCALSGIGMLHTDLLCALLGGGGAVAVVGFLDDRRPLPASVRFAVHLAAAIWAVAWLGGLPPLQVGTVVVHLGWFGHVMAVLAIVWTLNLFNFMDGIDAIAASEAVFVAAGGAFLLRLCGLSPQVPSAAVVFAAACAGFLPWNWPLARIFMGDVGSGFLGFVIAVLACAASRENAVAAWIWLVLGGVFFVDSTVTLLRRAFRGERVHEAHRNHAYQWLARRWHSHRRVTVATIALNVFWLFPCAVIATLFADLASWMVLWSFAPLVVLAVIAGSGRSEQTVP
jgi:Fuc2NAc and GlcNAc transferase